MESPEKVYLGDNTYHFVGGQGSVRVTLPNGEERYICGVLDVPTLKPNLISVSKVTDAGYKIEFTSDYRMVKDKSEGQVR